MNILGRLGAERDAGRKVQRSKLAVMEYLNRECGMTEADFLSAELCL